MNTPSWISALSALVGADALTTDNGALAGAAVQGAAPAAIAAPRDATQAAAVVRFAHEHKLPLLPRGSGTAPGIGFAPAPGSLALSTRRLLDGFAHEPADIVATLPAGMALGEAQKRLGAQGQWLPLDGSPRATIGGLIATDRSGPLAQGYGTLRDMVLGMTVINGDGVLRKCGGKVVKNVTGYALDKLYIGSQGTLGVITEATFKLRPLPIARNAWTVQPGDLAGGLAVLGAIAARNLPLESLVLRRGDAERVTLAVSAAGTAVELDRIHRELAETAATLVRENASTHWNPAPEPRLGAARADGAVLRFWCRVSQLDSVARKVGALAECLEIHTHGGQAALHGSESAALALAGELTAQGVNYRFEDVHGWSVPQRFGPPRPEWALMKQIHAALDPAGILNPGRFVV